jgi:hypothetical protein
VKYTVDASLDQSFSHDDREASLMDIASLLDIVIKIVQTSGCCWLYASPHGSQISGHRSHGEVEAKLLHMHGRRKRSNYNS